MNWIIHIIINHAAQLGPIESVKSGNSKYRVLKAHRSISLKKVRYL